MKKRHSLGSPPGRFRSGSDEIENHQVLCHLFNGARNQFSISSHNATVTREKLMDCRADCAFCSTPDVRYIFKNEYVYVISDWYPVTEGHTSIIPTRHIADAGQLSETEMLEIMRAYRKISTELQIEGASIGGFNFGLNIGKVAGQNVFHAHFRIATRRGGDVGDPTGGIRNVIPGKGTY